MSPQVYFNGPIGKRFREEYGEQIRKVVEEGVKRLCERPLADLPDVYLLPNSLSNRIVGSGYLCNQLLTGLDDVYGGSTAGRDEVTKVIDDIVTNSCNRRNSEAIQHGRVLTNWEHNQEANTWRLEIEVHITRIS